MSTVNSCPKCDSRSIGFDENEEPFGCSDCDWAGTPEELMEI